MGKKRRKRSARKSQRYDSHQRKGGSHSRSLGFVLREKLLRHLWLAKTPPTINHLVKELQLPRGAKSTLTPLLDDLLGQKIIRLAGRRGYELNRQLLLCEGVFEQNPKGFGFINRLDCGGKKQTFSRDPMLSASRVGSARQGDRVLIHIYNVRRDGRPEARLLTVLERQHKTLGGFVKLSKGHCDVTPEDPRFPFTIRIDGPCEGKMKNGDAVIVRLEEENDHSPLLQGSIIEYLGDPEQIDVQMRLVIEKFNLPAVFSDEALAESEHLSTKIEPEDGRADLRDIGHVTIDGETAKDFDDAVAVIKTRKGYRLYVSIADVSHYVHPGSGLDEDAHQRGTSIYFPGRVIPMLPEKLSNNLCSLVPGEDRFTVSAILDFDRQGNRLKKQFTKSIIHSHQRFTYTTVREILIDKNPEVRRAHKEFLTPLKWAEELARQLTQKRRERGSIGFTLPEPDIRLDEEGKIASITRAERNFAHQLIEEFMLAANEAVAETFTEEKKKGLYRIHEKPNQEKIREFTAFGAGLGLQLPPLRQDPDWFGQVL
ncbi:MAG: RNB domain-containing ribonuclease, partial [Thermodesulfobacteriota bacterium]